MDKNKTNVVDVHVNNIRPKFKNLKEWMGDQNNIYIGRGGIVFIDKQRFPKEDSIWCNPYKINSENNREKVLKLYEKYIREKIKKENLNSKLLELKGKNLGCWCKPEPCHGDILVKLIEEVNNIF